MQRPEFLSRRTLLAASAGLAATRWAGAATPSAPALGKITVAGWSKPISEITNLLAEPEKGFSRRAAWNWATCPARAAAMRCATR